MYNIKEIFKFFPNDFPNISLPVVTVAGNLIRKNYFIKYS